MFFIVCNELPHAKRLDGIASFGFLMNEVTNLREFSLAKDVLVSACLVKVFADVFISYLAV